MYDLIVIGGGWAGVNAAKKAKELGLNTCLIEKNELGGTCLNRGCIPTNALIQSARVFTFCKKSGSFGIEGVDPAVNFTKIQERKGALIRQLRRGTEFMLKGVEVINAEAKFLSDSEVSAGGKTLKAKYILIATGSLPVELEKIKFDGKKIISSDQILDLKEAPQSLLIIGGGVIGCEFANLFSTLGTKVTIVEKMPQLLPGIDTDTAKKIEAVFKKNGITVKTGVNASAGDIKDYELTLLCVGRRANTAGVQIEKTGIKTLESAVIVDDYLKTNIPNIYAAGDCTQKFMLAHFAAYQGKIAAQNMADKGCGLRKADNSSIPSCIFTEPEIACVGISETEAKGKGLNIKVSRFDFLGLGMARVMDETDGFIKIISDSASDEVLGAGIIGPRATEVVGILTLAVSARLKAAQLRDTIFAHPTISEAISEAL